MLGIGSADTIMVMSPASSCGIHLHRVLCCGLAVAGTTRGFGGREECGWLRSSSCSFFCHSKLHLDGEAAVISCKLGSQLQSGISQGLSQDKSGYQPATPQQGAAGCAQHCSALSHWLQLLLPATSFQAVAWQV